MARKCKIIPELNTVYFGELKTEDREQKIHWSRVDFQDITTEDESDLKKRIEEFEEINMDEKEKNPRTPTTEEKYFSENLNFQLFEAALSGCTDWIYSKTANYSLALTGKKNSPIPSFFKGTAFKFLIQLSKQAPAFKMFFQLILMRGQIYARMDPDGKRLLIQTLRENNPNELIGMSRE